MISNEINLSLISNKRDELLPLMQDPGLDDWAADDEVDDEMAIIEVSASCELRHASSEAI